MEENNIMRLSIFKKAERLKEKVVFEGEGQGRFFFKVNDYLITLHNNGKYTYLESCTCTQHAIHGGITDMKPLCSYVLAVYKLLPTRGLLK